MSWTDERVDTLKRLWSEGLSASQIADQLGGITRNAVIGKVHRLKLESRARVVPAQAAPVVAAAQPVAEPALRPRLGEADAGPRLVSSRPQPTAVPAQAVRTGAGPRSVGATALKFDVEELADADAEEARPSGEIVPISRKLSLVQLSENTCKWPIGDPLSADFHFCGHHSGGASPYCEYHSRLAFQQVERRRR